MIDNIEDFNPKKDPKYRQDIVRFFAEKPLKEGKFMKTFDFEMWEITLEQDTAL